MSALVDRIRSLTRAALLLRARDVTSVCAARSALILAPHPDDETLGCGATILRKVATGAEVTVLLVTDGSRSHSAPGLSSEALADLRRQEMAEAAARLGLREDAVRWAGIADGTAAAHEDRLVEIVQALLVELQPDELFATCAEEPHPDHAAVGRAARRAARSDAAPRRLVLLEYPVWLWSQWPVSRGNRLGSARDALRRLVRGRVVSVSTEGVLAAKLHALDAHASQLRRPPAVAGDEPWNVLPPSVLGAAAGGAELFFTSR